MTIATHQVITDVDITAYPAGGVSGRIMYRTAPTETPEPLTGGRAQFWRWDAAESEYEFVAEVWGDTGGTFDIEGLPEGDYVIRFTDPDGMFNSEWWEDARYFYEAVEITVVGGAIVTLGDVVLDPRYLDTPRIGGADRFEVGVNVSQVLFPLDDAVPAGGVPVVYVANGLNFPDALTAGPAAAREGGAVLLVTPNSIPAAVADELARLDPQRIVVSGGPASVSPAVFEQLQSFVPSPSDVVRAGGADRYETSRTIVRDAFEADGADIAIITTGGNFPDALSAGPAAASQDAPVVLVDGTSSRIDAATRQLLIDLGVDRVYLAGGTAAVSPGIESSLKGLLGNANVVRFAGADRFEVSVLLAQAFFSGSEFAFVATGLTFPDALTGGPLAAAYGAPLYLSRPECLPPIVAFDILDIDAQAMVLLGGPAALYPAVENLQLC